MRSAALGAGVGEVGPAAILEQLGPAQPQSAGPVGQASRPPRNIRSISSIGGGAGASRDGDEEAAAHIGSLRKRLARRAEHVSQRIARSQRDPGRVELSFPSVA